jgi:hypothetical protein
MQEPTVGVGNDEYEKELQSPFACNRDAMQGSFIVLAEVNDDHGKRATVDDLSEKV